MYSRWHSSICWNSCICAGIVVFPGITVFAGIAVFALARLQRLKVIIEIINKFTHHVIQSFPPPSHSGLVSLTNNNLHFPLMCQGVVGMVSIPMIGSRGSARYCSETMCENCVNYGGIVA